MLNSSTSTLGAAGEHYVMSQLLLRGFIAALAPSGSPTVDIILTNDRCEYACAIQVKSRKISQSNDSWIMKSKHEEIKDDSLFYVFLAFQVENNISPDIFVVPSKVVADVLHRGHRKWLESPGRNGKQRKDSAMRKFKVDTSNSLGPNYTTGWLEQYRDAWHLLSHYHDAEDKMPQPAANTP